MNIAFLDWQKSAACRDEDPELFFAPDRETQRQRRRREARARAICSGCVVRAACLEYRLGDKRQRDEGIWAGLDENERRRLRYNRARAARRAA